MPSGSLADDSIATVALIASFHSFSVCSKLSRSLKVFILDSLIKKYKAVPYTLRKSILILDYSWILTLERSEDH